MRIWLTGAGGFLGSRALQEFKARGDEVAAAPSALLRGEITAARAEDLARAAEAFRPDALMHMAALSDTGYCERHPEESRLANVLLPEAVARAARRADCALVVCSSDQVYAGAAQEGPLREDLRLEPANVYGRHKLEAEARVLDIWPRAACLRLTWLYDLPRPGVRTRDNLLVHLLRAGLTGARVPCSPQDRRGLTWSGEVIARLPDAARLPGGVYNFGCGNAFNMEETLRAFLASLGLSARADALLVRCDRPPRNLCMDGAKLSAAGLTFPDTQAGFLRCAQAYAPLLSL